MQFRSKTVDRIRKRKEKDSRKHVSLRSVSQTSLYENEFSTDVRYDTHQNFFLLLRVQ